FQFPGHTEYLQHTTGASDSLMVMLSDELRVGVGTGHVPLQAVAGRITPPAILSKLRIMPAPPKQDFWTQHPNIAVLAMNPHAGDNGLIGTEEQDIIVPALKQAEEEGIFCFGPYPADGFFAGDTYRKFDAVLAMYHDQGLIPFKHIAFHTGVNYTAG